MARKTKKKALVETFTTPTRVLREDEVKEEFRKYFVKLKRKHSLDRSLEDVIWLHLKAAGFAEVDKFDKGIEHFGL